MFPGGRRGRRRLHEQTLREAGVVRVQVHVAEPVGLERAAVQRRRLISLRGYVLKGRRQRPGNARQRRRSRHARGRLVDRGGGAVIGTGAALEVRDGLEGGAAGVVQARERGGRRQREPPRGVREVEPRPGAAAAQGEHRGVVRARRGLGGDVGAEPQARAAVPRDAHLAHPAARGAPAAHAAEHRVARLAELGAARGALLGRRRRGGRGRRRRLVVPARRGRGRRGGGGRGGGGRALEAAHVHGCFLLAAAAVFFRWMLELGMWSRVAASVLVVACVELDWLS
ncbi:hypothetical protein PVAP13_2NG444403 [Panicum virgatum]|uniref:Uncharacterized protein n=1 Tax=Panicum virgatum TaxID=38727 RepID=A0A8T0VST6_PANVG|nr:hypothetical protein PVAP13_2NG444403 [Panicum virgatum]